MRIGAKCWGGEFTTILNNFFPLLLALLLVGGCTEAPEIKEAIPPKPDLSAPEVDKAEEVWDVRFEITGNEDQSRYGAVFTRNYYAVGEFSVRVPSDHDYVEGSTGSGIARGEYREFQSNRDMRCTGEGRFTTSYNVRVNYQPGPTTSFVLKDFSPYKFTQTYICIWRDGEITSYTASDIVIINNFQGMNIELKDGAMAEETARWGGMGEMHLKATISRRSELTPLEDFDFDVDVDPAIVTITQGETGKAMVTVKLVRGDPKAVKLTATKWDIADISVWFDNPVVTPTGTTLLHIKTTCNTPPDDYLHTVQGAAGARASVDSVNLRVIANPSCSS